MQLPLIIQFNHTNGSGLVGVACGALQCGALWELLSYIQMRPSVIFCLFSVKRAPNSKFISNSDYIYDPLSIKINVEMGEVLL